LVSAIPDIHSKPEIVRVIGKEDASEEVGINGAMAEGQERPFYLTQGQYNVRVTTGASFATMREEAADFFQQVIQSQPQLMEVAGDLMFKYMDFPGAQALSERMKKIIPPHILDEEGEKDPATAALEQENQQLKMAMQQMQTEMQATQQQLDNKQGELQIKAQSEVVKAQGDENKNAIEIAKLQLEEFKVRTEMEIKQAELALKNRELDLKEQEALFSASQQLNAAQTEIPQSSGY
jgi:hypothetical protein